LFPHFCIYMSSVETRIYTSYFNLHFRSYPVPIQPHLRWFLAFSWSVVRMKWMNHLHYHQAYTQFLITMNVKNAFKHLFECYHHKANRVPEYKIRATVFSFQISMFIIDNDIDWSSYQYILDMIYQFCFFITIHQ